MSPWTSESFSFLPVSLDRDSVRPGGIYQVSTFGIGANLICSQYATSAINTMYGTIWNYTIHPAQNTSDVLCGLQARSDWHPYSQYRQAILFLPPRILDLSTNYSSPNVPETSNVGPLVSANVEICRNQSFIVAEWWGNVTDNVDKGTTTNTSARVCQPQIEAWSFDVVVNSDGLVQSHQITGNNATNLFQNTPDFLATYQSFFSEAAYQSTTDVAESLPYDWPGLLTARLHWVGSPGTQLEENSVLGDYATQIYARTFSHWFSLYRDSLLQKASTPVTMPGTVTSRQERMVPSQALFVVAFMIFGLQLCGSIAVYAFRRARCSGPRMPKSIGSIIPWVVHSRMLYDFKEMKFTSNIELNRHLENMGKRYGFGRFVDETGVVRLGIEEEAFLEKDETELSVLERRKP